MYIRMALFVAAAVLEAVLSSAQTASPVERELTIFNNEQMSVAPGYAVGNIAIGNPKVADFKVIAGRRDVLVFGKGVGSTRLTLWDQKNVKRDEIVIAVTTRQLVETLTTLRALLRVFPSVEVRQVAESAIVTGQVSSRDDQAAIEKIATTMNARSLVLYVPPVEKGRPLGQSAPHAVVTAPGTGRTDLPGNGIGRPDAISEVEYEVELLEASSRFHSGSYATGVEPSGRSLYKEVMRAPIGTDREVFIGGNAVASAKGVVGSKTAVAAPRDEPATHTGIKLRLRPTSDPRGKVKTSVLIETNLPFAGETFDPAVWRRARWEFTAGYGEPFGITGADLLATPDANQPQGSKVGATARTASKVAMIPGVGAAPGAEYVPVFGSLFGSRSYKQKATQLLVILRPRAIPPQP
jgi:hypothetical protein